MKNKKQTKPEGLSLEVSKYALSKILEVLCQPWQAGIDYDALKRAADRHSARVRELEAQAKDKDG